MKYLLLLLPLISQASDIDSKAMYEIWGKIHKPSEAHASPIGGYSAGCLDGAVKLPLDGVGYSVMRPSRERFYGHPQLVQFIEKLGKEAKANKLDRILIGDLSRPRGGPMISGHASHQIGLDVDVWYEMAKKVPNKNTRENFSAPNFVKGPQKLAKAWHKKQVDLVALAAAQPEVERIFVNATIKDYFCKNFASAPWLYKLRAWWGHDDHFHARLYCPEGSSHCQSQDKLDPAQTQCGQELAWWWSDEAKEELTKKQEKLAQRIFPQLPKECEEMPSK